MHAHAHTHTHTHIYLHKTFTGTHTLCVCVLIWGPFIRAVVRPHKGAFVKNHVLVKVINTTQKILIFSPLRGRSMCMCVCVCMCVYVCIGWSTNLGLFSLKILLFPKSNHLDRPEFVFKPYQLTLFIRTDPSQRVSMVFGNSASLLVYGSKAVGGVWGCGCVGKLKKSPR